MDKIDSFTKRICYHLGRADARMDMLNRMVDKLGSGLGSEDTQAKDKLFEHIMKLQEIHNDIMTSL